MAGRQKEGETPKIETIVLRRNKKGHGEHAHHGGAWKIAYADFMTAMMAFFLLMWLLGSTSKFDKQGIEDYFNTPLSSLFGGPEGTSAARPNIIQGGGRDLSDSRPGDGKRSQMEPSPRVSEPVPMVQNDMARLQQLKAKLTALIENTPALRAFKDQIRISITNEGLRIEIVDSKKRPMFASGSSALEAYAVTILTQIGAALNDVDNRISIAGHTDAVPYTGGPAGYSNWELSSERANAARRALVTGGMREDKLLQVRGLSDVLPLNSNVSDEPTNRRISILVLNKAAEMAFFRDGGRASMDDSKPVGDALPEAVSQMHGATPKAASTTQAATSTTGAVSGATPGAAVGVQAQTPAAKPVAQATGSQASKAAAPTSTQAQAAAQALSEAVNRMNGTSPKVTPPAAPVAPVATAAPAHG